MKLDKLPKITRRAQKRVGRGAGSGKGKMSGRGSKGQKSRGKVALGFIGGTLPFYKKIPYRRGLGNSKRSPEAIPVSLDKLSDFKKGETVDLLSLTGKGIITERKAKKFGAKIVSNGEIKIALNVAIPASAKAKEKIEKAGGKLISE